MKPNCLTRALDHWIAEPGYVVWRRSQHWPVAHTLFVSADGQIKNYVPPAKLKHPLMSLVGFEGTERSTDPASHAKPMTVGGIWLSCCVLFATVSAWALVRMFRR